MEDGINRSEPFTQPAPGPSWTNDERIDPRIRAAFAAVSRATTIRDYSSREEVLAEENSEEGQARARLAEEWFDRTYSDEIAPMDGLTAQTLSFRSHPDGNTIKVWFVRPDTNERLACVYYIHGGGMRTHSCFDGVYMAWARLVAAQGVAVAMVDFRNCVRPSSAAEVAPYPAGLNDCASGLRWLRTQADTLNIDKDRVVIAGDSGGGNLALATGMKLQKEGAIGLIAGLYALCPFIEGHWPQPHLPSSIENNGIFLNLHSNLSQMAYGIEAFQNRDPLAWPGFATKEDVRDFPRTMISVNECDPLRDEGISFYRLLLKAGVAARCRQVMGTIHATEIFSAWCPDISRDTASSLANFARG